MNVNKSNIEELLKTNVLKITFTKVDGSERTFDQATVKKELLPEKYRLGKEPEHIISDVVRVYLPDVQEWRSFNKSGLISAEIVG